MMMINPKPVLLNWIQPYILITYLKNNYSVWC